MKWSLWSFNLSTVFTVVFFGRTPPVIWPTPSTNHGPFLSRLGTGVESQVSHGVLAILGGISRSKESNLEGSESRPKLGSCCWILWWFHPNPWKWRAKGSSKSAKCKGKSSANLHFWGFHRNFPNFTFGRLILGVEILVGLWFGVFVGLKFDQPKDGGPLCKDDYLGVASLPSVREMVHFV